MTQGEFKLPYFTPGVVPGSDGAGVVEAVGSKVTSFQPGDRVCTHLVSQLSASEVPSFSEMTVPYAGMFFESLYRGSSDRS